MDALAELYDVLKELNGISIAIRLFLAVLCGGIIGLERGRKGQAAGGRTHMLVCIGSALVMMTNIYIVNEYGGNTDPTRLGAQVVSGIGFLGAGSILVTSKKQIRGLTTAAGLWASGCMGLAVGVGFYELAIIGNIFIFAVMLFNKFDRKIYGTSKVLDLYAEIDDSDAFRKLLIYCRNNDMHIDNVQIIKNKDKAISKLAIIFRVKTQQKMNHSQVIAELSGRDGVLFMEEL